MMNSTDQSKWCPRCKRWYIAVTSFYTDRGRPDGYTVYCKLCHIKHTTAEHQALRSKAINKLGGQCLRCGYHEDGRALAFDHINGDGYLERKQGTRKLLKQIINEERDDIQLLCCNCNTIKKVQEKEWGAREEVAVELDLSHDPAPPIDTRFQTIGDKWSKGYDRCVDCGRNDRRHGGFGYCATCYVRKSNQLTIEKLKWGETNKTGAKRKKPGPKPI